MGNFQNFSALELKKKEHPENRVGIQSNRRDVSKEAKNH